MTRVSTVIYNVLLKLREGGRERRGGSFVGMLATMYEFERENLKRR
jgi:hypothetical protein